MIDGDGPCSIGIKDSAECKTVVREILDDGSLEKEPSFLMVISCWKICRATAKLEDLECSSSAMENIA